jgi:TonB-linked SusC/RagA family outer membrane protein
MKLTLFFLLAALIHVSASVYSQQTKLSISLKNATVRDVLELIEDQSDYFFMYKDEDIDANRIVNIDLQEKPVEYLLYEIFKGTAVSYEVVNRQIVLVNKERNDVFPVQQQVKTVSGKVTDQSGSDLPGVTVIEKGTTNGTITDAKGNYSLRIPENATLQFSFVGMKTQEIVADDRTVINVTLTEEAIGIEEVVAIGYGTIKKSDLTGAIKVIRSDDIAYKATANVAQALQGKIAGVQVINSGEPGSSPSIRVRGLGSVRSDTEPLYVVDGVLTNNITFLGNNDIESMTVLKDASASAIYGVRAANGVIIITTKRGKGEMAKVDYSGYRGFQVPVNVMKMASTPEYLTLLNEKGAIAAKKTGGEFTPYNLDNYPVSTDWFDEILRNSASVQEHNIGFSGGNGQTQFALGGGYFSQEGLMRNHLYERINLRSSVESKVKKYLKVGLNANFSGTYTNNSPNVAHDAYVAPPAIAVIDPESGNYNALKEFGDYNNPMVSLVYNNNKTRGIRIVGSAFAELYLSGDLTFKSSYGVDGSYIRDRIYKPKYTLHGGTPTDKTEQLERKMTYSADSYWDNTLTYTKAFGDGHHLTAMAGISAQEQKSVWQSGARLGVPQYTDKNGRPLNNTLYLNLGDPSTQTNDDGGSHVASFSYFGRVNYSFKEKYLVTGTVRRDGSSIFPSENRFDVFPSVGLGWVLSNEEFMKNRNTFQNLKVRASWGEMGNNRIPELTAVSTVDYGVWNSTEFGGIIHQGASATYIGPANLLWEKTREYDLALEGTTARSRLSFELDFYHKKTIGAIFPVTVNSALGASNTTYLDNNADVVNKGIELSLSWKNHHRDFNYRIGGNMTVNDNEVVSLKPGTIGIYGGYMNVVSSTYTTVGHPISEFYGRKVLGIFQNDSEIANYKNDEGTPIQPNAQPGDFKYEDINQDGVINDKDRTFLGTALPIYSYALNLYFEYKGFDLVIDLYGQGGNHIYNAKRFRQIGNENYDKDFYDHRWHGEGTSTTYPSADLSSSDNKVVNSWYIEKGDFFRIQNIQIGYTLPGSLTSKIGIGNIRLFANATNPVTFFKYKGFSPEIIKTGAESATNQGVDSYVYPMSATYNFGLNISL